MGGVRKEVGLDTIRILCIHHRHVSNLLLVTVQLFVASFVGYSCILSSYFYPDGVKTQINSYTDNLSSPPPQTPCPEHQDVISTNSLISK